MGTRFLDDGLDELAARAYQGMGLRVAVTVGSAALVSALLPWQFCLVWLILVALNEGAAFPITRRQAKGHKAGPALRLAHLGTLVVGCGLWMVLSMTLWASGTAAGAVAGVILCLSVIFFAQNNAYQSMTGFVVGGVVPAASMLVFMVLGPNPLHMPLVPLVGVFLMTLGFVCDGVMRSVTIRRNFEAAQKERQASEAKYRMLANNVTDVIALNTLDGRRLYLSPSAQRALGYSAEELFDNNYGALHPDDVEWVQDAIAKLKINGEDATLQYRLMHKLGHPVWMEANFTVVDGETPDEPKMLLSVTRNIETRKALETELTEARHRAEQAAAAKAEFLANMTHELRTPLNVIIGFSGILKGSPHLQATDSRHAGLIHNASMTLLELVNSVLDFSKLDAGAVELEATPFDPAAPARAMVELLSEQARAKGLEIVLCAEADLPPVVGDPARIRHVLLNLLSNALKFTEQGGVTASVSRVGSGGGSERIRYEVRDTGIGLAPDQTDQLFDRFTQADASVSRKYGGTGLGLAICKRTIDLMGGVIGCHGAPGAGSTFWFELDLPEATALDAPAEAELAEAPSRPLRLLLVEDVAVNRELVSTLLSPFDVVIVTAENGEVAVEAMRRDVFDLVLMDIQMPVMDGLAATRAIRALPIPHAQTTPIIAMTANVLPDQVQTCREAGMDDHIGKPIHPDALLSALARWSAGRTTDAVDPASSEAATA